MLPQEEDGRGKTSQLGCSKKGLQVDPPWFVTSSTPVHHDDLQEELEEVEKRRLDLGFFREKRGERFCLRWGREGSGGVDDEVG